MSHHVRDATDFERINVDWTAVKHFLGNCSHRKYSDIPFNTRSATWIIFAASICKLDSPTGMWPRIAWIRLRKTNLSKFQLKIAAIQNQFTMIFSVLLLWFYQKSENVVIDYKHRYLYHLKISYQYFVNKIRKIPNNALFLLKCHQSIRSHWTKM